MKTRHVLFGLLWIGASLSATHAQTTPVEAKSNIVKQLSLTDTPARSFPKGYGVHCDRPKQCRRLAKRYARKKQLEDAIAFASKGLTLDPNSRTERKLLSYVNQKQYDLAYQSFKKKQVEYITLSAVYQSPQSAKYLTYLFWHTHRMNLINNLITRIDHPKVKVNVNEIPDERLGILSNKISHYRGLAAKEYLDNGKLLAAQPDKASQKRAYHYFDISDQYKPTEEAKRLRKTARNKATISLFIANATYRNHYTGIGVALDEQISAAMMEHRTYSGLTFFDMVAGKGQSDYVLNTVISEWEVLTKGLVTQKHSFTGKVPTDKLDEAGKQILKEITANITSYHRKTEASASVTWEVIERKTGTIVASGRTYGYHAFLTEWAAGRDQPFIPSKFRTLLSKTQDKAPSRTIMVERAISDNAAKIGLQVMMKFAIPKGSRLDR